jgi:hypothetical protein
LRDYLKISVRDIITVTFEESDPLTTTVVNLIPYTLETGINSKKLVTPLKEVDTPSDGFNSDLFLSSSEIEDDTSEDENYLPQ